MQLSPEQLDAVLASMGEGLLVVQKDYKIILINQAAGVLLKIAPAEAIGKDVREVFNFYKEKAEPEPTVALIDRALKEMNIVRVRLVDRFSCRDREGSTFPLGMTITPLLEQEVNGVVIIFHDLAEEKEIDRAKTEFVTLASHQLRTPLSTANWYTEMMIDGDVGKVGKEQRACLKEIYHAIQRMADLVNAFLSVSRIELGTIAVQPTPLNIIAVADRILKQLSRDIEAKDLSITKKYDRTLGKIALDPELTEVIFQNLISNAIKYTPKKGRITVEILKKPPHILIKVQDNGYGIPEYQQSKIFTKLFRADNVRERETYGNGLGLYIVKAVAEQSGGTVRFESIEDEGTTFYVTLPLKGVAFQDGMKSIKEYKLIL